jgi:hypothetical protein
MEAKLTKLYNTLAQIETKGENTKIMGVCLQFIEQLIAEEKANKAEAAVEPAKADEAE